MPSSKYFSRGRYGMIIENTEPQFETFEEAFAAIVDAWRQTNDREFKVLDRR